MVSTWKTPFLKQCFVTVGVGINMGGAGFVSACTSGILSQLTAPDSPISLNEASSSWIASLPCIGMSLGMITAPTLSRFGRRAGSLVSILALATGWLCLVFAASLRDVLVGRVLHGVSQGIFIFLGPVLVGEYTSPKYRGIFLMALSASVTLGVFVAHTLGSYLRWRTNALIYAIIGFVNMAIVMLSPESPAWLVERGRYEEGSRAFRWLRGDHEEPELKKMIEANILARENNTADSEEPFTKRLKDTALYYRRTVVKKEFYVPIIIMMHLYAGYHWCAVNVFTSYPHDFFEILVGEGVNIPIQLIFLDVNRVITNIMSFYVIKKFKRRTMVAVMYSLNIVVLLLVAGYSYAKVKSLLPFDHVSIGLALCHFMMVVIGLGAASLVFILAGEIYPLEYKSVAGSFSIISFMLNFFLAVKTVPYFFRNLGIYWSCCVYAGILAYCLLVVMLILPETKDRTLLDIEEELRGRPLAGGAGVAQPLTEDQADIPDSTNTDKTQT